MAETRAIILAAGFGSRLVPYTNDRPKCMVDFLGETILDRQLRVMKQYGIEKVAIVTGHGRDTVPKDGLTHFVNPDYDKTNMVASLMCAREWIESGDNILVSYGDIVYTPTVLETVLSHAGVGDMRVAVDRLWRSYWQLRMENPLDDAETMKFGSDGRIVELGKKPKSYDDIQGQYIGLQFWGADIVPLIMAHYDSLDREAQYDGKPFEKMFMTSFIQSMIDRDIPVMPAMIDNGWIEIDTVADIDMVKSLHEDGRLREFYSDV